MNSPAGYVGLSARGAYFGLWTFGLTAYVGLSVLRPTFALTGDFRLSARGAYFWPDGLLWTFGAGAPTLNKISDDKYGE